MTVIAAETARTARLQQEFLLGLRLRAPAHPAISSLKSPAA
jgi:hypothetical protein